MKYPLELKDNIESELNYNLKTSDIITPNKYLLKFKKASCIFEYHQIDIDKKDDKVILTCSICKIKDVMEYNF